MKSYILIALLVVASLGVSSAQQCRFACAANFSPVCGVDSRGTKKTFSNECSMNYERCRPGNKQYTLLSQGACPDEKNAG